MDILAAKALVRAQNNLVIASRVAHWNVRGENFYGSHLMYAKIYDLAGEKVDELIEVLRALGYNPTFNEFSGPDGAFPAFDHMALTRALLTYTNEYYAALVACKETCDQPLYDGLVNLLDELAQDATHILYLLSSAV